MKARIITGLIGLPLALAIMLFFPPWGISAAVGVFNVLAIMELLMVTGYLKHKGILASALVFAAAEPFLMLFGNPGIAAAAVFLYALVLVILQIAYHGRLQVAETGFVFFVSLVVGGGLSCAAYVRALPQGLFYIILCFIIAWFCDIGAYFVGSLCGKHPLCPEISPKKTVEGFIGGVAVAVLASLLGAWIYDAACLPAGGPAMRYWQVGLMALLLSPLSVLGDLFCSIIKRQTHVKDFGHVLPGHGGIMDRFDSLIFVAPAVYAVCLCLPPIA